MLKIVGDLIVNGFLKLNPDRSPSINFDSESIEMVNSLQNSISSLEPDDAEWPALSSQARAHTRSGVHRKDGGSSGSYVDGHKKRLPVTQVEQTRDAIQSRQTADQRHQKSPLLFAIGMSGLHSEALGSNTSIAKVAIPQTKEQSSSEPQDYVGDAPLTASCDQQKNSINQCGSIQSTPIAQTPQRVPIPSSEVEPPPLCTSKSSHSTSLSATPTPEKEEGETLGYQQSKKGEKVDSKRREEDEGMEESRKTISQSSTSSASAENFFAHLPGTVLACKKFGKLLKDVFSDATSAEKAYQQLSQTLDESKARNQILRQTLDEKDQEIATHRHMATKKNDELLECQRTLANTKSALKDIRQQNDMMEQAYRSKEASELHCQQTLSCAIDEYESLMLDFRKEISMKEDAEKLVGELRECLTVRDVCDTKTVITELQDLNTNIDSLAFGIAQSISFPADSKGIRISVAALHREFNMPPCKEVPWEKMWRHFFERFRQAGAWNLEKGLELLQEIITPLVRSIINSFVYHSIFAPFHYSVKGSEADYVLSSLLTQLSLTESSQQLHRVRVMLYRSLDATGLRKSTLEVEAQRLCHTICHLIRHLDSTPVKHDELCHKWFPSIYQIFQHAQSWQFTHKQGIASSEFRAFAPHISEMDAGSLPGKFSNETMSVEDDKGALDGKEVLTTLAFGLQQVKKLSRNDTNEAETGCKVAVLTKAEVLTTDWLY